MLNRWAPVTKSHEVGMVLPQKAAIIACQDVEMLETSLRVCVLRQGSAAPRRSTSMIFDL